MGPKDREGRDRGSQDEHEALVPLASLIASLVRAPEGSHPGFAGATESEILERITADDPLWLRGRSDARMRSLAYLIWLPRLELKTAARVAHAALEYAGDPPLAEWLASQVDRAIDDVLVEDREGLAERGDYDFVAKLWRTTPEVARRSIVAFNDLPYPARRAYWYVVVDGKSLQSCVEQGLGHRKQVEARLRRALATLVHQRDPGGADPPDGGRRVR
jgi:hypothetical protein